MKIKDISEVFGVPPSTFNDWKKNPDKKKLVALLSSIPKEEALEYAKTAKQKKQAPQMLLATINCSIGNKKNHLDAKAIKEIFIQGKAVTSIQKYALGVIKSEATQEEIESFAKYYRIPKKSIKAILNG